MQPLPVVLQAAILGVLQGLSEFLPVSSSAHLVLLPKLLGWPYLGKAFDVALHFGTLLALMTALRPQIERLAQATAGLLRPLNPSLEPERRLALRIVLGSVPVAFLGFVLEDFVEHHCQGVITVSFTLLLGAAGLFWAEIVPHRSLKELHQLTLKDAWLIGLAQALAIVPGVSRSGATMSAALALGVERAEAARFSFLLSLPVVAGASLYKALKLGWGTIPSELILPMIVGVACSSLSGYVCLRAFLRYLRRASLKPFAAYRVGLALVLLTLWLRS